jgi:hypothetical protein
MIKYENIRIHLTPVAPSEQIIVCDWKFSIRTTFFLGSSLWNGSLRDKA